MKLRTLAITTLATLVLGACGGASPQSGGSKDPDDEAELAFARCMRAAGIDVPDPGARSREQRVEIGRGITPQKLEAATDSCRKKTGGGPRPLTAEEQAEFRDAALKFAQCMRRNGIDVPDPEVGSGGIKLRAGRGDPEPDSPAFQRAEEACKDLLPRKGGPRGNVRAGGGKPSLSSSGK